MMQPIPLDQVFEADEATAPSHPLMKAAFAAAYRAKADAQKEREGKPPRPAPSLAQVARVAFLRVVEGKAE